MGRLRETLNPEEQQGALDGPTKIKTAENTHPLRCWACGEMYFVDEHTYRGVQLAAESDPSENPFYCDDCADEHAEEEHSH